MIVIGITGPTGAGKTTVLNVLSAMGGLILDCDRVYHDLTESCRPMRQELGERFGFDIFDENGRLKRKALGAVVFGDSRALAVLNDITHRYVFAAVEDALKRSEKEGRPAAAVDAIALLESGLDKLCDTTLAVVADDEIRVRRIMAREGISEEYARLRVAAQKPNEYYKAACDHILWNNSDDRTAIEKQAGNLFRSLIK